MSLPIILVQLAGNEAPEIDYVLELAKSTEHLSLGIDPEGTWEDAVARVLMIGQISARSSGEAGAIMTFTRPPVPAMAPVPTVVTAATATNANVYTAGAGANAPFTITRPTT